MSPQCSGQVLFLKVRYFGICALRRFFFTLNTRCCETRTRTNGCLGEESGAKHDTHRDCSIVGCRGPVCKYMDTNQVAAGNGSGGFALSHTHKNVLLCPSARIPVEFGVVGLLAYATTTLLKHPHAIERAYSCQQLTIMG